MEKIRTFRLNRIIDESRVSGTGYVAEGVVFNSGWCVLQFTSSSVKNANIYTTFDDMYTIHGHGGKTIIEWY